MELDDVRFYGTWRGRRIYRVLRDGRPLFTGTVGECRRYLALHAEKVRKDLASSGTVPRRRHLFVKTYRVSPRRAVSF